MTSNDPRDQRILTLEQLLIVQEELAARQGRELQDMLAAQERESARLRESEARLQQSEARTQAIVEASMDALITIDADGIVLDFNRTAEAIFGYTRQDAIGREMAELIIPERFRDAHRNGIARFLETGIGNVVDRRLQLPALRADGTEFSSELTVAVVTETDEVFFAGQVRDITQQLRDAEQLRHLQAITDAALGSLSLDRLLPELVERLESMLEADTVAIMLVASDDALELRAGTGLKLHADEPYVLPVGAGVAGRIASAGASLQIDDISELSDVSQVLIDSGVRSIAGAPMLAADRLIGVIHIGSYTRRVFTPQEVNFLERVAARISLAVEHASSFERERHISQTLQLNLLPSGIGDLDGLEIEVRYVPSKDAAQVGGDWYDALQLADGRIALSIGDVMGHDTRAASVMGQLRWALRAYAFDDPDPSTVLERVSRLTFHTGVVELASLWYGVYDPTTRTVRYSGAGHPPPLLLSASGSHRFLEGGGGPVVGAVRDVAYVSQSVRLEDGDALLLYTDGLIEIPGVELDASLRELKAFMPPTLPTMRELATLIDARFPPRDRSSDDDAAYLLVRPRG